MATLQLKRKRTTRYSCMHGHCTNKKVTLQDRDNFHFIPFPKPCTIYFAQVVAKLLQKDRDTAVSHKTEDCEKCSKCLRWLGLCRLPDEKLREMMHISPEMHICNTHFMCHTGPTAKYPDPFPASFTPMEIERWRMSCRKEMEAGGSESTDILNKISEYRNVEDKPTEKRTCTGDTVLHKLGNGGSVEFPREGESVKINNATSVIHPSAHNAFCVILPQPSSRESDKGSKELPSPSRSILRVKEPLNAKRIFKGKSTQTDTIRKIVWNRVAQTEPSASCKDQQVQCDPLENLQTFTESCVGSGWACQYKENESNFFLMGSWNNESGSCAKLVINIHVTVTRDLNCTIFVLGKQKLLAEVLGSDTSRLCHMEQLNSLLERLKRVNVCTGIVEKEFVTSYKDLRGCRRGKLCEVTGRVRSVACNGISRLARCNRCEVYTSSLRACLRRKAGHQDGASKFCNTRYLTKAELESKIAEQRKQIKAMSTKNRRLVERLKQEIENGVEVNEADNGDLASILEDCVAARDDDKGCGGHREMFIEEQRKAAKRKTMRGYKWHPTMIKWCLHLRSQSTSAYRVLRDSGFIKLPSERTLHNYRHAFETKPGLPEALPQEITDRTANLEGHQQYFALVFGEVKISEELVYRKSTGELIGYVQLDDNLNTAATKKTTTPPTHMFQLTVRGLTTSIEFPYAHFEEASITVDSLCQLVCLAVEALELKFGLKILAVVCVGSKVNRAFFRTAGICAEDEAGVVYAMENYFAADEPRRVYFVPDAGHLIKNVRNTFSESGGHTKSRQLWKNGQHIWWNTVVDAWKSDLSNEIRVLPKITDAHVCLTKFGKAKVKYVAQVLSASMAAAVGKFGGEEARETASFIGLFNKLFDVLNGRRRKEDEIEGNPDLQPYISAEDERLNWLEVDFAQYLDDWEGDVAVREGSFSLAERKKMILSEPTLEGLKIIAKSVPAIVRFLLRKGAESVFSGRLQIEESCSPK